MMESHNFFWTNDIKKHYTSTKHSQNGDGSNSCEMFITGSSPNLQQFPFYSIIY